MGLGGFISSVPVDLRARAGRGGEADTCSLAPGVWGRGAMLSNPLLSTAFPVAGGNCWGHVRGSMTLPEHQHFCS